MSSTSTEHKVQLDPSFHYRGYPYPVGIDPIWLTSENKILYLNSYKMKLSVILGVFQMLLGVFLSVFNHVQFRRSINIFCEFIPQVIFLMAIFGYMNALIVYKWFYFDGPSSGCAPSILITLINMFMVSYPTEPCNIAQVYHGQKQLQTALVLIAVICVPWMLILKPILIHRQRKRNLNYRIHYRSSRTESMVKTGTEADTDNAAHEATLNIQADEADDTHLDAAGHEEEESMGDVWIHQIIHTIEYCLGSISHTASYLRLWALSLAHAQLSEVLWSMVMRIGMNTGGVGGGFLMYAIFAAWALLTVAILLLMEGLSAFLHALRLHWVEFQSKFYDGSGLMFLPFSFENIFDQKTE